MRNSNDKFTNNVVSITKWIKKRLTIYSYEYLESTYIPQLANWHVFNANTLHFSESEFRFCYSRAQLLFLLLFLNINSMHFCMTDFHYENEFWFLFIGMTIFFFYSFREQLETCALFVTTNRMSVCSEIGTWISFYSSSDCIFCVLFVYFCLEINIFNHDVVHPKENTHETIFYLYI